MINLYNLFTTAAHGRSHLTHYVSVRWKRRPRKPSWLGMAKTKMFKIPERKELPHCEREELDRLEIIYLRQMASLKQFMKTNESNEARETDASKIIEENVAKSKALVDEWNAKSALLRKVRLEREKHEQEEAALQIIFEETEKLKEMEAKVEKIVTAEIAASSTYVTKENLDEVLDQCFNKVEDYNYALDLNGNIYKGASNVPVGKLSEINDMISDFKISDLKDHQSQKENLK